MATSESNRKMTKQEAGKKGGMASAKSRRLNKAKQDNQYFVL